MGVVLVGTTPMNAFLNFKNSRGLIFENLLNLFFKEFSKQPINVYIFDLGLHVIEITVNDNNINLSIQNVISHLSHFWEKRLSTFSNIRHTFKVKNRLTLSINHDMKLNSMFFR